MSTMVVFAYMCSLLLEKRKLPGGLILTVEVGPNQVDVKFVNRPAGVQHAKLSHNIGQQKWTHLAVQVSH